jgi:hypothetical protein
MRIQTALEEHRYYSTWLRRSIHFTADRCQQLFSLPYISFTENTLFIKAEAYTFSASRH